MLDSREPPHHPKLLYLRETKARRGDGEYELLYEGAEERNSRGTHGHSLHSNQCLDLNKERKVGFTQKTAMRHRRVGGRDINHSLSLSLPSDATKWDPFLDFPQKIERPST